MKENGRISLLVFGLFILLMSLGTGQAQAAGFSDINSNNADLPYITYLSNQKIISGYPDGTFRPQSALTRAQAAVVLVKSGQLNLDPNVVNPFKDLRADHWARPYIVTAVKAGYLSGYPDGSFKPDQTLSRAEGIALILKLSKQPLDAALPVLNDINNQHWAAKAVAVGLASGMVGLSSDGKNYLPQAPFTRLNMAHALGILLAEDPALSTTSLPGKIKSVQGITKIQKTGSITETQLTEPLTVNPGDSIITEKGASAELDYPDGSSVLIKEDTRISVKEAQGKKYIKADGQEGIAVDWLNLDMKQGTMFGALATKQETSQSSSSDTQLTNPKSKTIASLNDKEYIAAAAQSSGKDMPWYETGKTKKVKVKVDMPWGVAAIRGTFWQALVAFDGQTSVSCLTGDAEVTSGGQTVSLGQNQSTQITSPSAPPPPPAHMPPAAIQQFAQEQTWIQQTARIMDENRQQPPPPPPPAVTNPESEQPNPATPAPTANQPGPASPDLTPVPTPGTVLQAVTQALTSSGINSGTNQPGTQTASGTGTNTGSSGNTSGGTTGGSSGGSSGGSGGGGGDSAIITGIDNINVTITQGDSYSLPSTVAARMSDSSTRQFSVTWSTNNPDTSQSGTITITGTVSGYSPTISLTLTIKKKVTIVSIADITAEVTEGDPYVLPDKVTAVMSDSSTQQLPVTWSTNSPDTSVPGVVILEGSAAGYTPKVKLILTVAAKAVPEILGFNLAEQTGTALIDKTNHTVNIEVTPGTALTMLVPTISLSEGAVISPASQTVQNFTGPVSYTVSAPGQSPQTWTVKVTVAKSSNAQLNSLSISGASISPAFSKDITSYSAYAEYYISSISVNVAGADANAQININGQTSTPGSASAIITLNEGSNPVNITVIAEDGTTSQIYSVDVTRAQAPPPPKSSACEVISVESPALAAIDGNTITAGAASDTTSTMVSLTVSPGASWKLYSNSDYTNEIADKTMSLAPGVNSGYIEVTAEDGVSTNGYILIINREVPVLVSSIADLTDVINTGASYTLPAMVKAWMTDNTIQNVPVSWNTNTVDTTIPGTYTFTGNVSGYNGTVTLTLSVQDLLSSINEGFENGWNGWAHDGLWQVYSNNSGIKNNAAGSYVQLAAGDTDALPNTPYGNNCIWYGKSTDANNSYTVGNYMLTQKDNDNVMSGGESTQPNSGSVLSPVIAVPASVPGTEYQLSFQSWWEIEGVNSSSFDLMQIYVKPAGQDQETPLGCLNPQNNAIGSENQPAIAYSSNGYNQAAQWKTYTYSLANFAGQNIQVRFAFDTKDPDYNAFRGWFIDEVKVVAVPITLDLPVLGDIILPDDSGYFTISTTLPAETSLTAVSSNPAMVTAAVESSNGMFKVRIAPVTSDPLRTTANTITVTLTAACSGCAPVTRQYIVDLVPVVYHNYEIDPIVKGYAEFPVTINDMGPGGVWTAGDNLTIKLTVIDSGQFSNDIATTEVLEDSFKFNLPAGLGDGRYWILVYKNGNLTAVNRLDIYQAAFNILKAGDTVLSGKTEANIPVTVQQGTTVIGPVNSDGSGNFLVNLAQAVAEDDVLTVNVGSNVYHPPVAPNPGSVTADLQNWRLFAAGLSAGKVYDLWAGDGYVGNVTTTPAEGGGADIILNSSQMEVLIISGLHSPPLFISRPQTGENKMPRATLGNIIFNGTCPPPVSMSDNGTGWGGAVADDLLLNCAPNGFYDVKIGVADWLPALAADGSGVISGLTIPSADTPVIVRVSGSGWNLPGREVTVSVAP